MFAIIKSMSKNQYSSRKLNKPITIGVIMGGLVLIGGFAVWILVSLINHPSLLERLTSTIKEHTIHPEFFTESKIIDKYDAPVDWNINGDGEMRGTFQLSKVEATALLQSNNLLKCPPSQNCQIDTLNSESDCAKADVSGRVMYELCVDSLSNQVKWLVVWY